MKKTLIVMILLSLVLNGCSSTTDEILVTEDTYQVNSIPIIPTEDSKPTTTENTTPSTIPSENHLSHTEKENEAHAEDPSNETETSFKQTNVSTDVSPTTPSPKKESCSTNSPAESNPVSSKTSPTESFSAQQKTDSTEPASTQQETDLTEPSPTQQEIDHTESSPTQQETAPTVPAIKHTEPTPTEPIDCTHDWTCIHHDEVGHWKAGIICDCGWTVYGSSSELVSKWNAHSVSYSPEESLFHHGGYGSADQWIVDIPAYDEWVCSLCGEK